MGKLWRILGLGLSMFIMSILMASCGFLEIKLPDAEIAQSSKILDIHGEEIAILFEENRIPVDVNNISQSVLSAIVAVEDARFYTHYGIDPIGILRALATNVKAGKIIEGGSTITQQTAKNLYLTHERTWQRKIKELIYTLQLEQKYTKEEILELYLNQIYFGEGAYGIEVAAQTYLGKAAKDLSLAESAYLVGLPQRPNFYNPFKRPEEAKKRQLTVLSRMLEQQYITQEQFEQAEKEEIVLKAGYREKTVQAAYFINEIRQYITEKYDNGAELLLRGGLTVQTTLDLKWQKAAEKALQEGLGQADPELQGAIVALDPHTGGIRAMVGGKDFGESRFNRVFAERQPGSAFKPFLYAAALDNGYTAASMVRCEPFQIPVENGIYEPKDFGDDYHHQDFTLYEALSISDNVIAVKLNYWLSPRTLVQYAERFGIEAKLRPYPSLALGTSEVTPMEMAKAFSPFANLGKRVEPYFIVSMTDYYGRILEENEPVIDRAVDPVLSYLVVDMMQGVVQEGGTAAQLSEIVDRPIAGKTGTSQNYQDLWFVGVTPDLSAAVYVGYDKPRSTGRTGGNLAGPIWARFVKDSLEGVPAKEFPKPQGIDERDICPDSGLLTTEYCPEEIRLSFAVGTEPKKSCNIHSLPTDWFDWIPWQLLPDTNFRLESLPEG